MHSGRTHNLKEEVFIKTRQQSPYLDAWVGPKLIFSRGLFSPIEFSISEFTDLVWSSVLLLTLIGLQKFA